MYVCECVYVCGVLIMKCMNEMYIWMKHIMNFTLSPAVALSSPETADDELEVAPTISAQAASYIFFWIAVNSSTFAASDGVNVLFWLLALRCIIVI